MIDAFPQADVVTAFGQTECSPVTCLLRGEDAIRKIGSIGQPIVNVEARIVDDEMNDVPRGEVGEIVYRGPLVMSGYWNKPEATAEAFRGGWFHSGDLVREDEDGYLFVVDRVKDMIISGGENIYCAEVENVLAAHPEDRRGRADRGAGREVRRGAARRRRRPRSGRSADRGRRGGVLPRAARRLQAPARPRARRRAAAQPERQGAQDPATRAYGPSGDTVPRRFPPRP